MIYLCNSQVREQANAKREDEDRKRKGRDVQSNQRRKTNLIRGDNYKMGRSKGPEFGKEEEEQTDAV